MKKISIVTVVLVLAFAAGGFFAGVKYQESKSPRMTRQFANGQFPRVNGEGRLMGGRVVGEIIGKDDKSITVKLPDGGSKIVLFSEKTELNKAASATRDELKTREQVVVFGSENSDGSVIAQNIQLNPMFRGTGSRDVTPTTK